jgi:NADPH-dependent ferric siderophore reductase
MPILEAMHLTDVLPASIAWQPGEGDLVLLAAGLDDLVVVESVLATLPTKARGQVFIEVDGAEQVSMLDAPGRVCVTWLRRDLGQSMTRSVDAWLAEMLPFDIDREHRVYGWIAGDRAARVLTSEQPV